MNKRLKGIRFALVALGIVAFTTNAWSEYTDDCISFTSSSSFKLRAYNWSKNWNGTLWTSTDRVNWTEWTGDEVSAAKTGSNYQLHVRGDANNTEISGLEDDKRWYLRGNASIACSGNLETLRGATGTGPSSTAMGLHCYWVCSEVARH